MKPVRIKMPSSNPLVLFSANYTKWFKDEAHTIPHRLDGPATIWWNNAQEWSVDGKWHRVDGPARENPEDGSQEWWVKGERHRVDGPAIIWAEGSEWWHYGKRHRVGGPAIERINGHEEWWVNGECHRIDGPAVKCANGDKEWWLFGEASTKEEVTTFYAYTEQLEPKNILTIPYAVLEALFFAFKQEKTKPHE